MNNEPTPVPFNLAAAGMTDVGRRRSENQDRILLHDIVYAVADGMGGHEAGEVASQLAVETMQEICTFANKTSVRKLPTVAEVQRQVQLADDRIREALEARGGTTLCALLQIKAPDQGRDNVTAPISAVPPWTSSFSMKVNTDVIAKITPEMLKDHRDPATPGTAPLPVVAEEIPNLLLVNVGDSRGYRLRDGALQQLTRDHSAVQEMVDAGQITESEARNHPHRNLITRALGAGAESQPDVTVLQPRIGDRYLLCSDGLSGELTEDILQTILVNFKDRSEAVRVLTGAALEAGGRDNIAVIVIDVVAAGNPEPDAQEI
ncbi:MULTISPECIES: PP2C family protein-serine/threonine phosphatase [Glutamicibacter]|uniref:Protein phosphatase 2C domain-containing protein n=1 Tax=Glutamicibacter halophytocola TaxID=1933880 RepID=A0AA95BUK8_9MICC|nr:MULTISPECIES: protein phosphatase 2C domain-containing protein [Glutamicibacter]MBF6671277.1 serine/threonine-protein phosphatase [Glutamicibacter sp. FBE19]NQD39416.1 serine/threonine-protein phosphatase [Glutamicibacter halophytocola]UUX59803.1 protein phosphatase 2C domain-containing protein [Glutamicibacter halophytocola]